MTASYSNFLKLRQQAFDDPSWDVMNNQNFAILDFVNGSRNSKNRLLSGGAVTAGTGLNANFAALMASVAGSSYQGAGSSVAVTASTLNYIYVSSTGVVTAATSPPTGDYVALAVLDTDGSSVLRVGDCRTLAPIMPAGENVFINGTCELDQENEGAAVAVTTTDKYFLDMWLCAGASHSAAVSAQRGSGMGGFDYSAKITVTTADTLAAGEKGHGLKYYIEYRNARAFKDRSLPIRVVFKGKITGTYSMSVRSGDLSNSYVTDFTLAGADTEQVVEKLIPLPATKIIEGSNNRGLVVTIGQKAFDAAGGATSTLDQWQAGSYVSSTTAVDWETATGNYIEATGLLGMVDQLPDQYPFRDTGRRLALCERYLRKSYNTGVTPGSVSASGAVEFKNTSVASAYLYPNVPYGTKMRNNPSAITIYSTNNGAAGYVYDASAPGNVAVSSIIASGQAGFSGMVLASALPASNVMRFHYVSDARM